MAMVLLEDNVTGSLGTANFVSSVREMERDRQIEREREKEIDLKQTIDVVKCVESNVNTISFLIRFVGQLKSLGNSFWRFLDVMQMTSRSFTDIPLHFTYAGDRCG